MGYVLYTHPEHPSPAHSLHYTRRHVLYYIVPEHNHPLDECDESFDREWLKKEARKVCQSKVGMQGEEEEEAEHEQVCGCVPMYG